MYLHLTPFHWLQTFDKDHKKTTGNLYKNILELNISYLPLQIFVLAAVSKGKQTAMCTCLKAVIKGRSRR